MDSGVEFGKDPARLETALAGLYGAELKSRMDGHHGREEEFRRLAANPRRVELTGKDFPFRGMRYRRADAKRLLDQVKEELDSDMEWMSGLDKQVFVVHYVLARQLGDDLRSELEERYRFHQSVQGIHSYLIDHRRSVEATLEQSTGQHEISQEAFAEVRQVLGDAHNAIVEALNMANTLHMPALKNVTPGTPLGNLLGQAPVVAFRGYSNSIEGKWIAQLMEHAGRNYRSDPARAFQEPWRPVGIAREDRGALAGAMVRVWRIAAADKCG